MSYLQVVQRLTKIRCCRLSKLTGKQIRPEMTTKEVHELFMSRAHRMGFRGFSISSAGHADTVVRQTFFLVRWQDDRGQHEETY